jgi:predicted lipoprotein with Yx(FWY)xxD motif
MIDPSPIRRPARLPGFAGLAVVALAFLVACTSATTTPSGVGPATSSPAAIASLDAASPSPASASPSSAGASASPSKGPGRYGGGDPTPTPKPTSEPTPKPSPKPSPKPASLVVKSRSTSLGKVLVGPNGRTLYTLSSDPNSRSGCSGSCATNWPPLMVASGTVISGGPGVTGKFGSFARSGRRQVTYRGRALYYYKGDSAPGQTNGDGAGGVWYVATP